ncbi:MAG: aminodeoxychorismate/anthranilate synthase component II [Lachnospiraceae bacterium]|nr:aminodeoxychorismate/anthranilate synthase component II [Lachnospiraceae bacterium]
MILLIDNYDSFSYNLYQLIGEIQPDICVVRNDEITINEIEQMKPTHIIISPGPGKPSDAGICEEVIKYFAGKIPILGVCLGHQAICETYGATVGAAKELVHGKQHEVVIDNINPIFAGLPETINVARYHSLAAWADTMPENLHIIAHTVDGEVMAVCHTIHKIYGLQFHPESILTPDGRTIISNFLKL